ncbi:MoxR family ATPase [Hahella aquimaris]|uniref:AAA family ATPase n=1 Tax=Hahella sp. HNIBRBA332 TaxID=3015983 RepID=UPI00273A940F|nr:MoxR family ATPase [Hahella sp. HNIBRBA332]WLQ15375.1 MoxR family ATPase [Hahella sp. HNIBRBA332]
MTEIVRQAVAQIGKVVLGKEHQIKLALTSLLCQGHLLIEDLPGMGKTTLSHAMAQTLGLSYNRVQFTSDLLPSDLIGINLFDKNKSEFTFHKGPLFAQLVLADEINRATPKAQSALLEAMEERQISVEGTTYTLPKPFFVIATQNPSDQSGTFLLPESQMDRFFMRIHLGYPPPEAERELLKGSDRRSLLSKLQPVMPQDVLAELQAKVLEVRATDPLIDYIQRIIAYTRSHSGFKDGISPRGAIALLRAAKGWALLEGRQHVLPDDVQTVLPAVVEHRLGGSSRAEHYPLSTLILREVTVV